MSEFIWPDQVKFISGPVSFYVFKEVDGGKKKRDVYLLGDVHHSYRNTCAISLFGNDSVINLNDLIGSVFKKHDGASLFVEYPFTSKIILKNARYRWYFDRIKKALQMDSSTYSHLSSVLHRLFGIKSSVTGMLSKLYNTYSEKDARIRAIDIRSEPNVNVWDSALHFSVDVDGVTESLFKLSNRKSLTEWMHAYVFDDDFIKSVRKSCKGLLIEPYFTEDTLVKYKKHKGIHEIRHVFLQLPKTDQNKIAVFAKIKVKEVMSLHRRLQNKYSRSSDKSWPLTYFIQFAQANLMDIYAVCKMMQALRENDSGPLMVYAGDYHIVNYCDFFKFYTKKHPDKMHEMQLDGQGVNRCISVE
jgi:hypothetical protein